MTPLATLERARIEAWTDDEIVRRVLEGDIVLFELLMRRHNQRVYRAIRSIVRDDGECEDIMQEAYVRAYQNLSQFQHRAQFSTWLTRIAVNESLKRLAARGRFESIDSEDGESALMSDIPSNSPSPESQAARTEVAALLEEAILALPQPYRTVLVLRDVEEMSTAETAEALSLTETNVKVRLHRAHDLLRQELASRAGASAPRAFQFHAVRCDRVVHSVMSRIQTDSTVTESES